MENEENLQPEPEAKEPEGTEAPELIAMREQLATQQAELAKNREALQSINAEATAKADEARQAHEEELRKGNKYKQLYEIEQKKSSDTMTQLEKLKLGVVTTFKSNAKREAALSAGIRPEAMKMIEVLPDDELQIRTSEGGSIDVTGTDKWIENLQTSDPYMFKKSQAPNIPGGRPSPQTPQGKKINMLELERSDPDEYKRLMSERIATDGLRIN